MFYVYVLKSPSADTVYIGFSSDLRQRIKDHGTHPMHRGWKLVYYEAYLDEKDARERERMLKHYGASLGHLKARIGNSLEALERAG